MSAEYDLESRLVKVLLSDIQEHVNFHVMNIKKVLSGELPMTPTDTRQMSLTSCFRIHNHRIDRIVQLAGIDVDTWNDQFDSDVQELVRRRYLAGRFRSRFWSDVERLRKHKSQMWKKDGRSGTKVYHSIFFDKVRRQYAAYVVETIEAVKNMTEEQILSDLTKDKKAKTNQHILDIQVLVATYEKLECEKYDNGKHICEGIKNRGQTSIAQWEERARNSFGNDEGPAKDPMTNDGIEWSASAEIKGFCEKAYCVAYHCQEIEKIRGKCMNAIKCESGSNKKHKETLDFATLLSQTIV